MEGGLRAALDANAPGLAEGALWQEVEVRHAVLWEEERRALQELAAGLSASLSMASCIMVRRADTLCFEFAHCQLFAADFQHYAQARVLGVQRRGHGAIACVLQYTQKQPGW